MGGREARVRRIQRRPSAGGLVALLAFLLLAAACSAAPGAQRSEFGPLIPDGGQVVDPSGPVAATGGPAVTFVGSYDGDIRDLPPVASRPQAKERETEPPRPDRVRAADGVIPVQPAAAVTGTMPAPATSFEGLAATGYTPPDPVGDVGPNHYIEAVNVQIGIYSKTGTTLASLSFNTLWQGRTSICNGYNASDPTVIYDPMNDRWIVADIAFVELFVAPHYQCIAVSKTGDPVAGGWWFYAVRVDDDAKPWLQDYPKMAIWPGSLLMTANMFSETGFREVRAWAFNLADLESGSATIRTQVKVLGDTYFTLLPANLRGAAPPGGSPAYLVGESISAWGFEVLRWSIDWTTNTSTISGPTLVSQTAYDWGQAVVQPGSGVSVPYLEPLIDRLMMQAQYRNLGGVESIWVAHTVGVGIRSAIQWAQLDVTGGVVATTPVQQGIWTGGDDGLWRWMPSLAVDGQGNMAVGYSASSGAVYPGLRIAGRLASDPLNALSQGEVTLVTGTTSQQYSSRWGDYFAMSVDPVNDCTFWFVGQYISASTGSWTTRIGSLRFPSCVSPTTTVAVTKVGTGTIASAPAGISCGSTCSYAFNYAAPVNLTATPASGWAFGSWSGACSGTSTTCTVTSDAARSVTATFGRRLTLTKNAAAGGTVTSSVGGIDCATTCTSQSSVLTSGQVVTLTAAAASGYTFRGWSGNCSGTSATCTLTMSSARNVTATFGYPLTVTKNVAARGTITSSPSGISCRTSCLTATAVFGAETIVTLSVSLARGFSTVVWSGCTPVVGRPTRCTVTLSAATSVTATIS